MQQIIDNFNTFEKIITRLYNYDLVKINNSNSTINYKINNNEFEIDFSEIAKSHNYNPDDIDLLRYRLIARYNNN